MGSYPLLMPKYDDTQATSAAGSLYDHSVLAWTDAAFEEAEYDQSQSEELSMVQGYIEYLFGKQWTAARPSYKSKPVNNRMIRLFWELVGQLTDIRPIIEIHSTQLDADKAPDVKRICEVLNGGLRAWSLDTDFDQTLAMCISYAVLTTAFAKIQWNPFLNFGRGELEMVPLPPDAVMPLKAGNTLESAEAVIYKEVRSLRAIRQMYPLAGSLVQPDPRYSNYQISPQAPANIPVMIFNMLSPGMKRQVAGGVQNRNSSVPMALVKEFWIRDATYNTSSSDVQIGAPGKNYSYVVKPGKPLYPRGRLIVTAGRNILHDGPNPYWHGKPPFAMLRLNVVPWQFYGISDLRAQVPLQDIINNILAGVLDCIKRAVNPAFFAPKNAFSESVWQSLDWSVPNARAAYNPQSAHEPKFAPPPVLPGFVLAVSASIEREMDQTSTGGLTSELAKKKQLPSSEGIDQLKAEKQTPVRLKGRNIESFIRVCGQMMTSNIIQFWDGKKRMQVLGTKGMTFEDFDWDRGSMVPAGKSPEDFARDFKFYIQPGSLLSIKRVEEKIEAFTLFKMRALSLEGLYRKLGGDYDVPLIKKELVENAKLMAAVAPPPKGKK